MGLRSWFVAFAVVVSAASFGWDAKGHQIVGEIAYRNLTATAKAKIDKVLASDPDMQYHTFYQATTWADDIKKDTKEFSPWHYIDNYIDHPEMKPPVPNVLTAIDAQTKILKENNMGADARLRAVKWLLHLIGDVHQPLHATSRIVNGEDDQGGNKFVLDANGQIRNLHYYWDNAMTRATTGLDIAQSADKVTGIAKKSSGFGLNPEKAADDLKPEDWAMESFHLCEKYVYNTKQGQMPDSAYSKMAEELACVRGYEAGLRMAAYLNSIFDAK